MKEPLSGEALSHFIGLIYDCALEPKRWPETLTQIREALDFANAALALIALPSCDILIETVSSDDPGWIERGTPNRTQVIEVWGGEEAARPLPLLKPLVLSRLRPRSEWENSSYVREWAGPHGIHDILAIGLTRDATSLGTISFGRHVSAGEIEDPEVEAARLLIPHLLRAVAISKLLDVRSIVAATFESTLDALAVAVVLTDIRLRIVHANAAARAMFASRDPIRSEGGTLALRSVAAAAALRMAVRQAAETKRGSASAASASRRCAPTAHRACCTSCR